MVATVKLSQRDLMKAIEGMDKPQPRLKVEAAKEERMPSVEDFEGVGAGNPGVAEAAKDLKPGQMFYKSTVTGEVIKGELSDELADRILQGLLGDVQIVCPEGKGRECVVAAVKVANALMHLVVAMEAYDEDAPTPVVSAHASSYMNLASNIIDSERKKAGMDGGLASMEEL
jgi:hypothetical protein